MQSARQALTDTEIWHWGWVPLRKGVGHCWHNVKTLLPDKVGGNECTEVTVVVCQPVKHETLDEVRDATMKDATTCKCHPRTVAKQRERTHIRNDAVLHIQRWNDCAGWSGLQRTCSHFQGHAGRNQEEVAFLSPWSRVQHHKGMRMHFKGIRNYTLPCEVCQKHNHAQLKEPIVPDPRPQYPWERVSEDIMEYNSWSFLVTVDYSSNFSEVDELTCSPASAVIWEHKAHFTRCGTWTAVLWQRSSACKQWIRRICHTVAIHTEHKSRSCPIR